ncbi:MAG: hypothetical protein Q4E13_05590 [Clostridia bacterium]|nr:hypothetical protein [Clostridia bacterium]
MKELFIMDFLGGNVHQALQWIQLAAVIAYCLTLIGVMAYYLFSRKKVTTQEHAVIVVNLEHGVDTAVRWGVGICFSTLLIYIAMWFFGTAGTQQTVEECLGGMLRFWMFGGMISYIVTIFLGMAMKGASECEKLCKLARRLPVQMIVLGFVAAYLLAFLRC